MLKFVAPMRGSDAWGSGKFGASRGKRKHRGIDVWVPEHGTLLSPIDGQITKLGFPYADDLSYRYIEITDFSGFRHRFFYSKPLLEVGDRVFVNDEISVVQDIASRYHGKATPIEAAMKNHVHYEIIDRDGAYVDPEAFHRER